MFNPESHRSSWQIINQSHNLERHLKTSDKNSISSISYSYECRRIFYVIPKYYLGKNITEKKIWILYRPLCRMWLKIFHFTEIKDYVVKSYTEKWSRARLNYIGTHEIILKSALDEWRGKKPSYAWSVIWANTWITTNKTNVGNAKGGTGAFLRGAVTNFFTNFFIPPGWFLKMWLGKSNMIGLVINNSGKHRSNLQRKHMRLSVESLAWQSIF